MSITISEFFDTFLDHPWPSDRLQGPKKGSLHATRTDLGEGRVTLRFYSYGVEKLRVYPRLRTYHAVSRKSPKATSNHVHQLRERLNAAGYQELIL